MPGQPKDREDRNERISFCKLLSVSPLGQQVLQRLGALLVAEGVQGHVQPLPAQFPQELGVIDRRFALNRALAPLLQTARHSRTVAPDCFRVNARLREASLSFRTPLQIECRNEALW